MVRPEDFAGTEERVGHLVRVHVGEAEARALAGELVVRDHRVAQAARLAHEGKGAIAHGNHLGEAAWLELGRHEKDVAACVHAVRERVVERDARAHHVAVLLVEVAERLLLVRVASAKDGHLDAALHDAVHGIANKAQALLVGEAADHDHERSRGILAKAQLLLEGALALGLVGKVVGRVVRRDHAVGLGVPDGGVDAVENAGEDAGAPAEDGVEPFSVERHLQLVGIARAHGGEGVRVAQAALHEVDGVLVAVELVAGGGDVGKAEDVREHLVAVLALELDVVDRHDGLDVIALRGPAVQLAQEDGAERRLPVVAVQDVAGKLGHLDDGLADCLREEREALAIVKVAVESVTLEVGLVVHEVEVESLELELLDAAVDVPPGQGHVEVRDVLHAVPVLLGNGPVLGHDYGGLGTGMLECAWEGTRHVTQAAGLGERHRL